MTPDFNGFSQGSGCGVNIGEPGVARLRREWAVAGTGRTARILLDAQARALIRQPAPVMNFAALFRKRSVRRRSSRFASPLSRWWNDLRFHWHTKDKDHWIFALLVGLGFSMIGYAMYSVSSYATERRELTCLAMNVYYEARGESLAGMHAVAEVTMNRVASRRYPDTVCEVVYEKRWDALRKRYVGAFSWTEFDVVPHPEGEQWQQAWEAARNVYRGRHSPTLDGALHYHATYIRPSWSRGKKPVARIGAHVFYR